MNLKLPQTTHKRIVVIGGGFAGMNLALHLKNTDFQVVLLDKHNYHTFQPLLYQVATGGLEPTSIAYPLRKLLRKIPNAFFRIANVENIDTDKKIISTDIGSLEYDILVIATGTTTNFFNLPQASTAKMKSLKSISEALDLRSYLLENFEMALLEDDPQKKQALINIVIVGGGPTGVELAGAIAEMKNHMLPRDYKELDLTKMQVHLYEATDKLLGPMTENSRERALEYLKNLNVQVNLKTAVKSYEDGVLYLGEGQQLPTETVIWTAGVKGKSLPGINPEAVLPNGRIKVDEYNQVPLLKDVYAIGDISCMITEKLTHGHPMVAPVAIQQGELLAKNFIRKEQGESLKAFEYFDKGSMATVGRNKAVVDFPGKSIKMGGFMAWIAWMFVHLMSLVGFRNKLIVLTGWVYNYLNYDRVLRLIIRPSRE
ncbi:MAG: NAD(P)/FAD-dependent oxidoreductase [Chitinophagales bacterium]|nr:NAD(P)/FAD-dependent oxidoreductase [Chitinophagales bacterium]